MNNRYYKREWIQYISASFPEIVPISDICSAPNCDNSPAYVCIGNIKYFLCKECAVLVIADLVMFEKRYAAYEGK